MQRICDTSCEYSKKQRFVMCGACKLGDVMDIVENMASVDAIPVNWIQSEIDRVESDIRTPAEGEPSDLWKYRNSFMKNLVSNWRFLLFSWKYDKEE